MRRFYRYWMLKLRQWSGDLERVPGIGKIVAKSKEVSLPGLQKVPLYDVMRFFGMSMSKGVVFQRAAAITYRVFVAVIPMISSSRSWPAAGVRGPWQAACRWCRHTRGLPSRV